MTSPPLVSGIVSDSQSRYSHHGGVRRTPASISVLLGADAARVFYAIILSATMIPPKAPWFLRRLDGVSALRLINISGLIIIDKLGLFIVVVWGTITLFFLCRFAQGPWPM
jgi:hypothetical protein